MRRTYWQSVCGLCIAFVLGIGISAIALPSENKGDEKKDDEAMKLFKEGSELATKWKYDEALPKLKQASELKPNDPDILNMLAYTQRNSGQLEQAIANYHQALQLRPKFPEAREYLGEAYVQGAIDQIKALESYGEKGSAARQQVIDKLLEAAAMYQPKQKTEK